MTVKAFYIRKWQNNKRGAAMKWYKVIQKIVEGVLLGGAGALAANPGAVVGADSEKVLIVSAIAGLLKGFVNWYKHKND